MDTRRKDCASGHLERKKTGYWYMVFRTKDEFRTINTWTKDRAEAQAQLDAILAKKNAEMAEAIEKIPLSKVWRQYDESPNAFRFEEKVKRKKRSAWLYLAEWMHEHHPEIDEAAKITPSVANEYMNHYRKTHTATTCNNKLVFFTGMFNALERDGVVSRNPWHAVKKFPKDGNVRRELSADEVGRIIAEAANKGGEWRDLIMIGLYTGLRLGDCCLLDWKDIDLKNMVIQVIPRKTAKYAKGQPVTIPIHPQLLEVLSGSKDERRSGHVLRTMPDMYLNHNSTLTDTLRKIFTEAGIETSIMLEGRQRPTPYATFHSLRHSFVSFATNSGVPLPVVQSIVGHHSSAMTRHYYHANEEALRKAVDAVPDFEETPRGRNGVEEPRQEPVVREATPARAFARPSRRRRQEPPQERVEPQPVQRPMVAAPPPQTPPPPPRVAPEPPRVAPEQPKPPVPAPAKPAAPGGGRSLVERMKEAMTLYKEGMITEDEFNALRRQILATA